MRPVKKNFVPAIVLLIFCGLFLAAIVPADAATSIFDRMKEGFTGAATNAYNISEDTATDKNAFLNGLISIINYLLTFLGLVFFLITLYAGWHWLTARGNTEEVEKAKKMIQEAVIALIIVFFARLITELVLSQIGAAVYVSGS